MRKATKTKKRITAKFTNQKIEKNITQIGAHSFRVQMQIGGLRVSKVFDTLDEARTYRDSHNVSAALDVHETAIFRSRIKKRESKTYTFADAIEDYRKEKTEKKKGYESEGNRLDRLARLSIAKKPLYMIGREDLIGLFKEIRSGVGQQHKMATEEEKKDALKRSRSRKKITPVESHPDKEVQYHPPLPVTEGTVKRYYNLVHHIFEVAVDELKKLDRNPCSDLKKGDIPKDNERRERRLVSNEYEQLLEQLTGDAKIILILAVETAMRRQEFMSLEWENISTKDGIAKLPDGKTGARQVPLSSRAVAALKSMKAGNKVVQLKGKVFKIGVMALRYQWRKAREAIGSTDLRIHDLRHQAASSALERGLTIAELKLLTGHKSLKSLKSLEIYLQAQDLKNVAKKLG